MEELCFSDCRVRRDKGVHGCSGLKVCMLCRDKGRVFVRSYKPDWVYEAQTEWKLSSEHLQPPHPNVSSMLDFEQHAGLGCIRSCCCCIYS